MKKLLLFASVILLVISLITCNSNNNDTPNQTYTGTYHANFSCISLNTDGDTIGTFTHDITYIVSSEGMNANQLKLINFNLVESENWKIITIDENNFVNDYGLVGYFEDNNMIITSGLYTPYNNCESAYPITATKQ